MLLCADGYISVMNVELNMKEMLELGKRASQAAGRGAGEADSLSVSSRYCLTTDPQAHAGGPLSGLL